MTFLLHGSSLLLRAIERSRLITSSDTSADDWTVLFLTASRMVLGALGEDVEGHYHCDKIVNIQCAWNENGLIFSFDCVGLLVSNPAWQSTAGSVCFKSR